ncbi:ABC transporter ATP-binding protein [Nannocystis sp. ILAH1]|uniref:ATP-binding cassette domain-containing protein n=1 Tax=Nannocystis sp. ILAH1 TaxID=2996789 RepID=UPI00226FA36F|nr:ABC transporter ATP-binding protein [Nannocystis sp. ILAH1]MCY0994653.1 ABC transporter ATP-binding protein [Nannocystis sp. ILAH1]
MTAPLVARGLTKRYGTTCLFDQLDLDLDAGEVLVLVGPNGAGKSTLIGCLTGGVIPDAGRVVLGGHDLRGAPLAARAALRYLPQEVEVPQGLTGRELVEFYASVFREPLGGERVIALADLGPAIDHLATTYSLGMRKRLVAAALTLGDGALYVLDEPFAGLDREARGALIAALVAARARGVGLVLSAHDPEDIAALGGARVLELGRPVTA